MTEANQNKQASLAECLKIDRRVDAQQKAEAAYVEAQTREAKLEAEKRLAELRQVEAAAPVAEPVEDESTEDDAAQVDWDEFSDEQLLGMIASAELGEIDESVIDEGREGMIAALEKAGFKPDEE